MNKTNEIRIFKTGFLSHVIFPCFSYCCNMWKLEEEINNCNALKMQIFKKTIQILIGIFTVLSVLSLIYTIVGFSETHFCFRKDCYDRFIKGLIEYQVIYLALIGLVTLSFGFYQIETIIRQNKERRTLDTLNQISHFYIEIQNNIKEFYLSIEEVDYNFFETEFVINDFTDHDLAEQDEKWCHEYSKYEAVSLNKNRVTLMLARIESFSNFVLYGNIDLDLFQKLLGIDYKRQIEILYPFISSYRSRNKTENYYSGIKSLYEKLN